MSVNVGIEIVSIAILYRNLTIRHRSRNNVNSDATGKVEKLLLLVSRSIRRPGDTTYSRMAFTC